MKRSHNIICLPSPLKLFNFSNRGLQKRNQMNQRKRWWLRRRRRWKKRRNPRLKK